MESNPARTTRCVCRIEPSVEPPPAGWRGWLDTPTISQAYLEWGPVLVVARTPPAGGTNSVPLPRSPD